MANQKHLTKLGEGVEAWNQWRKENPDIKPDLKSVDLEKSNLSGAEFAETDLKRANLSDANLTNANFSAANLADAYLYHANLTAANFRNTNLTDANLSDANLTNANFSAANITDAYLYRANLTAANFINACLERADLSFANLKDTNFRNSNLSIANLRDANLSCANLEEANFYRADLSNANLSCANLKRTQALCTNFFNATLTDTCIEDWNINNQTNLKDVKCDCIYLKLINFKRKLIYCNDRRPHDPNQVFKPGEFTKLFQKALETVDLIFSEGIEWTAFLESFQQLQAEVKSEDLSIQAIEKKGRAFIVRLEVPESANKAEIERYIKQEYDAKLRVIEANCQQQIKATNETIQAKEELIEVYKQQVKDSRIKYADMQEIAKLLSQNQQKNIIKFKPIMTTGNQYHTKNAGIVHNEKSDISGDAKIAGVINEAEKQNLVDAATKIQQLLEQLSKTYPTTTSKEKNIVVGEVIDRIENNPTLKAKVINALKAGGTEAFKEAIDHPLVNILVATIEGWQDAE